MRAKFRIRHYTEDEVTAALHENTIINACYKLGLFPQYWIKSDWLKYTIAIRRLKKLVKFYEIL